MLESPLALFLNAAEHDRAEAQRQRDAADAQLKAIESCKALAHLMADAVEEVEKLGFSPRLGLAREGRVLRFEVDVFAARQSGEDAGLEGDAPVFTVVETETPALPRGFGDATAVHLNPTPSAVSAPAEAVAPAPSLPFANTWTDEETAELVKLHESGMPYSAIAKRLKRSSRAVSQRYQKIQKDAKALERARGKSKRGKSAEKIPADSPMPVVRDDLQELPAAVTDDTKHDEPIASPGDTGALASPMEVGTCDTPDPGVAAPAPNTIVNLPDLQPDDAEIPPADRSAWQRIKALGRGGTWSIGRDIALIEGLTLGRKLVPVADEIGVLPAAAKGRFQCLCPDPSVEEQVRVLRLLKRLEAA